MRHVSLDRDSPGIKERRIGVSQRDSDEEGDGLIPAPSGYPPVWEDHSGGAGAFASAESFLPILQTLCANDGRVLGRDLVDEMFRPQLSAQAKAAFNETMKTNEVSRRVYGNSFDVDNQEFDHGLGGELGLKDEAGSRAAGTMSWGGLPNLIWWIDRKTGLCGAQFTQLLPMGDPQSNKLEGLFEKAVYERYREFLSGN